MADPSLLRAVLESSSLPSAVAGRGGEFLWVNQALCDFLGRTCDELATMSWQPLTHPDDLSIDEDHVRDVLAGVIDSYRLRKRYVRPEGAVVWGDLTVSCLRDESGEVRCFLAQIAYQDANPAACAYLGMTAEQLMGLHLLDMYPSAAAAVLRDMYARVVETGEPLLLDGYTYPNELFGGEIRYYDLRGARLGDGLSLSWRDVTDRVNLAQRVSASEARLRSAMDSALDRQIFLEAVRDDAGAVVDLKVLEVNRAAAVHLASASGNLIGEGLRKMFGESLDPEWWARLVRVVETGEAMYSALRQVESVISGPGHWYQESAVKLDDGLVLSWRDVTEEYEATQAVIREANEQYRLMVDNSQDVVFHVAHGLLQWIAPSAGAVLGYPADELVGRPTFAHWHPDDLAGAEAMRSAAYGGRDGQAVFRWQRKDGQYVWIEGTRRPVVEADGSAGAVGMMRDVTDRVEAQQQVASLLRHDSLTGLPTREVMLEHLTSDDRRLRLQGRLISILCVSVDHLSAINDGFGHSAGDVAISTVAARIGAVVRDGSMVARGASVDLYVLLDNPGDARTAAAVADQILREVAQPIEYRGHVLSLTASIGVATGGADTEGERLLRAAGVAMRRAKAAGGDSIEFDDREMADEAAARVLVVEDARAAIANGEFEAWLMPIVDLNSREAVGHEALVRWPRNGSWVGPEDFLHWLEVDPAVVDFDIHMLQQSLRALTRLPDAHFVSVNITPRTLTTAASGDRIRETIIASGVNPRRVHLEVTETSLLALSPNVLRTMRAVADLGVGWYVDDFGTGYSSISHLRDLPISGLKLDQSFTTGIGEGDDTSLRLAQALAGLSHGLGLDTVAEGVETAHQEAILSSQGWRYGQGWLYGKATPLG